MSAPAEPARSSSATTARARRGHCDHAAFASPQPGWAEQSPDDWWRATQAALRAALTASRVDPRTIGAIGLSGQMHGAVLLDADLRVVRPAIIWCDQRTEANAVAEFQHRR
jgi:xylulokinase